MTTSTLFKRERPEVAGEIVGERPLRSTAQCFDALEGADRSVIYDCHGYNKAK